MTLRHTLSSLACAALLAAGLCAPAAAATGGMLDELNIVYVKAPFNLQNMVLKDQRMLEKAFEKYGTRVNWHTITSGAKQAQAMAAGSIDVSAVMNTASLLMANGAGTVIYIADGVAHPADTFAIVGPKGKTLSVKDLEGKKVAGPRGTVLHQLLAAALKKEGLSMKDVEFVSMDPAPALSALMAGSVDAALIAASAVIKAEEAGCKTITTASGLVNVNLVLTASESFAKNEPEALKLVVETHRKALEWIRSNKDKALEIGAREHGISPKDAETLARWSNYYSTVTEADIKGLAADQEFLIENGMMQRRVDVEKLVLPSARQ